VTTRQEPSRRSVTEVILVTVADLFFKLIIFLFVWKSPKDRALFVKANIFKWALRAIIFFLILRVDIVPLSESQTKGSPKAKKTEHFALIHKASKKHFPVPFNKESDISSGFFISNGVTYLAHNKEESATRFLEKVTEQNLCVIIPYGKQVLIQSAFPPQFFVNLEDEALFSRQVQLHPVIAFLTMSETNFEKPFTENFTSFLEVWSTLDHTKPFVVTAYERKDVPDTSVPAMICF
jgi:hypothetical protein